MKRNSRTIVTSVKKVCVLILDFMEFINDEKFKDYSNNSELLNQLYNPYFDESELDFSTAAKILYRKWSTSIYQDTVLTMPTAPASEKVYSLEEKHLASESL